MKNKISVFCLVGLFAVFLAFCAGFAVGKFQRDVIIEPANVSAVGFAPVKESEETDPEIIVVDLNTATAEELISVPGIGESYANAIIAHREAYGKFSSVWELDGIKGFNEKKIIQIAPYLHIST